MKISIKLMVGFVVIIAFAVVLAAIGIWSSATINENYKHLLENPIEQHEYLNNVELQFMTMRFRAGNYVMNAGDEEYINKTALPQCNAAYEAILENIEKYLMNNQEDKRQDPNITNQNINSMNRIKELIISYKPLTEKARELSIAGEAKAADDTLKEAIPLIGEFNTLLNDLTAQIDEIVSQDSADMNSIAEKLAIVQICMTAGCIVLALILALYIVRFISNQVQWYQDILDHIPMPMSVTDMHRKTTFINKPVEDFLGIKRKDAVGRQCSDVWKAGICNTENCGITGLECGKTSTTFNQVNMDFRVDSAYLYNKAGSKMGHIEIVTDITEMLQGQKEDSQFVQEISDISQAFVRAARDIDRGATELAANCTEQTSEVGMLSGSVSDVAEKTQANTSLAGKSSELADKIKGNAEKGSAQMDKLARAVEDINSSIQSISKVFKFIDDIAFQTNILALNAAVEAARAGQHGKGFAVVAEEVRNLAAKSAASAKDTDSLLTSSIEKANSGVQIAGETATSLKDIVSGIEESSLIAKQILHSSEEQNKLIDEINKGITEVSQGVQKNSAMAQESAAASTEMNEQAVHLQSLIDEFQKTVESYYD